MDSVLQSARHYHQPQRVHGQEVTLKDVSLEHALLQASIAQRHTLPEQIAVAYR